MRLLAFWLLLGLIFIVPWEYLARFDEMRMLSAVAGVGVAGVWALAAVGGGRVRMPPSLWLWMAAFVAWTAASLLWTLDTELTWLQVQTYGQLLLLALIVWDLVRTEVELRLALQAYVLGCWVCILRLVEAYVGGDVQRRFTVGEFNQNTLGLVLALALPLAWHLATGRAAGGGKDPTARLRLLNFAFIPGALFGILLTGSRASLLGALLGFGYMALGLRRARWGWRIAAMVLAGAIAGYGWRYVPETSIDRYQGTTSEVSEGDWNGRLPIWEEGLRIFEENWIVGVGARAFIVGAVETNNAPHNLVLSLLAELGVIGFGLFAAILVSTGLSALRQPGMTVLWLTTLAVWLLNGMTHNFEDKKVTWVLFMLVAVSEAARRVTVPRRQPVRAAALSPAGVPARS